MGRALAQTQAGSSMLQQLLNPRIETMDLLASLESASRLCLTNRKHEICPIEHPHKVGWDLRVEVYIRFGKGVLCIMVWLSTKSRSPRIIMSSRKRCGCEGIQMDICFISEVSLDSPLAGL